MAGRAKDTLYVIAAAYDDVDAAVRDDEGVEALYREVRTSHDVDASGIAKDADGRVRILADQVAATITAANRVISEETDLAADRLAADMRRAPRGGEEATHAPPVPQQASRPPDAVVTRTAIAD